MSIFGANGILFSTLLVLCSCSVIVPAGGGDGADADTDSDADADADSDTDTDTDCAPNAYQRCVDGEVHSFDSCDNDEGAVVQCGEHASCVDLETDPPSAECQCDLGWAAPPSCEECAPGFSGTSCQNAVVYVDGASAAAVPDGASWETAFPSVNEGAARACDLTAEMPLVGSIQIWVASGSYSVLVSARSDTVLLCDGVSLLGGFSGDEASADERDPVVNPTALDGNGVYHVITGGSGTLIDGFAVSGGDADGDSSSHRDTGGGLFVPEDAAVTASRLFVSNNGADSSGGGIAVLGSLSLSQSSVVANTAEDGGGLYAAPSGEEDSVEIDFTLFASNTAARGGGVLVTGGTLSAQRTALVGNAATVRGGAIALFDGSGLAASNLLATGNTAAQAGGALDVDATSTASIAHATILRNGVESTTAAGAGIATANAAGTSVINSIVWMNENSGWSYDDIDGDDAIALSYSATSATDYVGTNGVIGDTSGGQNWVGLRAFASTSTPQRSAAYDAATATTTVVLDDGRFEPGELAGMMIDLQPWDASFRLSYVVDNTGESITVYGDVTASLSPGSNFGLFDPHLSALSPCIDTADDASATANDFDGAPRLDVFGRGGVGVAADMGAYESQETCVRTVYGWATAGAGTGLTWNDAFTDIQAGLDAARALVDDSESGLTSCEVWVASYPDIQIYALTDGATVPEKSLHLRPGVSLYGSFSANDTMDKARRNLIPYAGGSLTTLLGTDTGGTSLGSVATVVTAIDLTGGEVFDGFLVTGGVNTTTMGGGMLIQGSSMSVRNTTFFGNSAVSGGGAYMTGSTVSFSGCTFETNAASAGYGGGIYADGSADLSVDHSVFEGNSGSSFGGAISTDAGGAISDCIFANNGTSSNYGGAIDAFNGVLTVVDSAFLGNTSSNAGSVLGANNSVAVSLTGVTTYGNTAATGHAIEQVAPTASLAVANSVLWNDTPSEIADPDATSGMTLVYSDVAGLAADAANHVYNSDPWYETLWNGVLDSFSSGDDYAYFYPTLAAGESWDPDAFAGMIAVITTSGGAVRYYPIAASYTTYAYVVGDLAAPGFAAGDPLQILSLHPGGTSVCVDTGDDALGSATDILGTARFDYAGAGDTGTITDLGAYEALPPE